MIILNEELITELRAMNTDVGSPLPLAAIYTSRDTVIISDRCWLMEWPIDLVASCSQLAKLECNQPEVFKRPEALISTPWAKLLFPNKDRYVDCDEVDPEDIETEEDTEEEDEPDTLTYVTDETCVQIKFARLYVEMMLDICEEPTIQIYMQGRNTGSMVISEGGRRVGTISPWVEE